MFLFVWEGVLTDYTDGIMFAVAENVEDARVQFRATGLTTVMSDCEAEPDVILPITAGMVPYIKYLYGGG